MTHIYLTKNLNLSPRFQAVTIPTLAAWWLDLRHLMTLGTPPGKPTTCLSVPTTPGFDTVIPIFIDGDLEVPKSRVPTMKEEDLIVMVRL